MKTSNILYVAAYKKPCKDFPDNPARKVGITGGGNSTTKDRMNTLSNGTEAYSPVEAIQSWQFPDELSAKTEEDYLHNLLDAFDLRTNREWFNGGNDEINKVEEVVEMHMLNLIAKGFKIRALHEEIDEKDTKHEIVSDDNEKIKIKGKRRSLPKSVTVNGEKIQYKKFGDILTEVFKILVDKNKITKEMCPISKREGNKNYVINTKPEHSDEAPFRGPSEYKGLYVECWHSAQGMYDTINFIINKFGNNEFILNIEE